MANVVGRLVAIIDGDLSGLQRAVGQAQATLQRSATAMSNVGRALSIGVTAPIVAVGGLALKASVDFESAFAGVRKTVDATDQQFAQLDKGIRDMAKTTPASATSIAAVAEAAGQLGIQTDNILSFTKVMIDLGNSTNLTADQAATAFAQIANVMKLPQDQFDEMGSALVDLGNKGASTESDIIDMAQRIAGAGATVGMSTADVLGLAAALANVGIDAEAGGTSISRVMITMANAVADGGDQLDEFAKTAGMTSQAFAQEFQTAPAQAIQAFITGLGKIEAAGGNVFQTLDDLKLGEIRVRDALLRTASSADQVGTALNISENAWQQNTALTDEASKRYATTASKLQIAKNRLNDVAITLGTALVPALIAALNASGPLVDVLGAMAQGFAGLPGPLQTAIVGFAGFAAALGPTIYFLSYMARGVAGMAQLIAIAGQLGPALMSMLPAIEAMGAALLTPPVGLIVALVAIGVAAYIFRDQIKDALTSAGKAIAGFASDAYDKLKGPFEDVLGWLKSHWNILAAVIAGPFAPIVALATNAFGIRDALLGALKGIAGKAGQIAGSVASAVSGVPGAIAGAFSSAAGAVAGAIGSVIDAIAANFTAENLGKAVAWFFLWPVYVFRTAFEAVMPFLTTFFTETLPGFFTSTLPGLATSGAQMGASIATSIWAAIKSGWSAGLTFFTSTLPNAIVSAAGAAVSAATDLGGKVINGLVAGFTAYLSFVVDFWTKIVPNAIVAAASFIVTAAKNLGPQIMQALVDGVTGAISGLVTFFTTTVPDAITSAVKSIYNDLLEVGKSIVTGVWDGVQSLGSWFGTQIGNFFKGLKDTAMKAIKGGSPSLLFAEVGKSIVQGVELGLAGMSKIDLGLGALVRQGMTVPLSLASPTMPALPPYMTSSAFQQAGVGLASAGAGSGSGIAMQFNGPFTVQNVGNELDTERTIANIAFASAYEFKARGGRG